MRQSEGNEQNARRERGKQKQAPDAQGHFQEVHVREEDRCEQVEAGANESEICHTESAALRYGLIESEGEERYRGDDNGIEHIRPPLPVREQSSMSEHAHLKKSFPGFGPERFPHGVVRIVPEGQSFDYWQARKALKLRELYLESPASFSGRSKICLPVSGMGTQIQSCLPIIELGHLTQHILGIADTEREKRGNHCRISVLDGLVVEFAAFGEEFFEWKGFENGRLHGIGCRTQRTIRKLQRTIESHCSLISCPSFPGRRGRTKDGRGKLNGAFRELEI
jgi:hypothetical protein